MLPAAALPPGALVLLLDSPSSLSRAEALLLPLDQSILSVAMDAEWGPTEDSEGSEGEEVEDERRRGRRRKGAAAAATLVQIALRLRRPIPSSGPAPPPLPPPLSPATAAATTATTATTRTLVLLFDLVRLDHAAAAPLLGRLLSGRGAGAGGGGADAAVRLGWGLRGDLAALVAAGDKGHRKTAPAAAAAAAAAALSAAARVARPAVDLRGAVPLLLLLQQNGPGRQGTKRSGGSLPPRHGMGLAAAVAAVLGLDLDKGQQRSPWGRRPLSRGQLEYAALDAAVLLDLAEAAARRFLLPGGSEGGEPPSPALGASGGGGGGGGEQAEEEEGGGEGEELARVYSSLRERFARVVTFDGSSCGDAGGKEGGGGGRRPRRQRARRKERARRAAAAAEGEGEEEGDPEEGDSEPSPFPPPWKCPSEARFLVDNNEGLARQLRLWGVDAASAPAAGAIDSAFASASGAAAAAAAAAAVAAPRSSSLSFPSPSSNRGGRGARAAERAAALLATAAAEGRVLLTGSRALLQLSASLSSATAASSPPSVSLVHILVPPSPSPFSSSSSSSSSSSASLSAQSGKNAPPARELAASVLRHFGIRPGVGGGGGGEGRGVEGNGGDGDGEEGRKKPSSSSLLSRCSACNGDFLPRPFFRNALPQLALDALSRGGGGGGKKKSAGGRGRGGSASDAAASEKEAPLPPAPPPAPSLPFPEDKELWVCSRCGKCYWNGGMYARAVERMTKRLEDGLLG